MHFGNLYEAKILKIEGRMVDGNIIPHYYVHYQGWKDRWNEWIDVSRMSRINEETRKTQKMLRQSMASKQANMKKCNNLTKIRRILR